MDDDEHLFDLLRRLHAADERRHRTDRGSAEERAALEETEHLIDRILRQPRHDRLSPGRLRPRLHG